MTFKEVAQMSVIGILSPFILITYGAYTFVEKCVVLTVGLTYVLTEPRYSQKKTKKEEKEHPTQVQSNENILEV